MVDEVAAEDGSSFSDVVSRCLEHPLRLRIGALGAAALLDELGPIAESDSEAVDAVLESLRTAPGPDGVEVWQL